MTVIAWDGKTLAADRQTTMGDLKSHRTKLVPHPSRPGVCVAFCGDTDLGLAMIDWFLRGATKEDFPAFQRTEKWVRLLVFGDGLPKQYLQEPFPIRCEADYWAWGSGAELAIGAMAAGVDAVRAVEIANQHCATCGFGVDHIDIPTEGGK